MTPRIPFSFPQLWSRALRDPIPNPAGSVGILMNEFGRRLNAPQVFYTALPLVETGQNLAVYLMDLANLNFTGLDLNVVVISHPARTPEEEQAVAETIQDYKQQMGSIGCCFYIVLGHGAPPRNPFVPENAEVVYLGEDDLSQILTSDVPQTVLFAAIRRQIHVLQRCPFSHTAVAQGSMFKGRKRELHDLQWNRSTSFIIMGARRIGKTSLLQRAAEGLRRQGDFAQAYFLDCRGWNGLYDCADRLVREVDQRSAHRLQGNPTSELAGLFEHWSQKGQRKLFLFLDEYDGIVDRDLGEGWQFTNILRNAMARNWIRVVFAGFRSVKKLGHGAERNGVAGTPLHLAADPITLGPLSREDTGTLLSEPFLSHDVELVDPAAMVEKAYQQTSGHAFVVQWLGEILFRMAMDNSPMRLTSDCLDAAVNDFALSDFLLEHLYENTIERGEPVQLERALVFVLAHAEAGAAWTEQDFARRCGELGYSRDPKLVHDALSHLFFARVLNYNQQRYSLTFPLMREAIRGSYPDIREFLDALPDR